jgi:F0F1-type ATP synthase assembly protein I
MGVVAAVFSAISDPLSNVGGSLAEKTKDLIPDRIKDWLAEVVSSRHKEEIEGKKGSPIKPTKVEIAAYITSIVVLGISFAYVKVITLDQLWTLLPVFFITRVLVGFVQKYFSIAYMRSRGVWSEHKIWPLGLVLFLFTTFAFKVPFSSPTRSVHKSKEETERLSAFASMAEILISVAFAAAFFILFLAGFTAIGGAGLAMCIIGSFVGTLPIKPMSGKDIFDYSKSLWAGLFFATLAIFVAWMLLM